MRLFSSLITIWVLPFYRRNAGFFLFFFFIFFGTVSPESLVKYHLSIIQSILSSYATLTGVLIIWLLYNTKCIQFIYNSLKAAESTFLYQLQALSRKRQTLLFGMIEVLMFLPVGAYILLVFYIALQQDQALQAGILLIFLIAVCMSSSLYIYQTVNSTWKENKPALFFKHNTTPKPKNLLFILVHYSLNQKKVQLLVLKLFSFIVLYIALVWNADSFDHDSLVLFLVVMLLSHALLAFQYVQFIEKTLLFVRNLPLPTFHIFLAYFLIFALIFLPELVYITWTGHALLAWQQIVALYLTLVNTLLFFATVQYSGTIDRNEFVKIIFGVSFVSIFFYNNEQYAWWAALTFLFATLIFFTSYPQYEPPSET